MSNSTKPNAGKNKFTLSVDTESNSDSSDIGDFQNGGFFWAENDQDHGKLALKALNEKNYDAFNFLVTNGVVQNFDVKDSTGSTILHKVVESGNPTLVKNVLNNQNIGSIINAKSNNGDTPLIMAVKSGNDEIAHLLVSRGADRSIRNNEGFYVGTETEAEKEVVSKTNVASSNIANDLDMSKDTESILDSIFDSYMKKQKQVADSKQTGGSKQSGASRSSNVQFGSREMFMPKSRGAELERKESKETVQKAMREESSKIHDRVVQKIQELLSVDVDTAKVYKSLLWTYMKDKHPELSNYDRTVEMEKNTNLEFLTKTFTKKDFNDRQKLIAENKKKREDSEKSISESSTEIVAEKKSKKSTKKSAEQVKAGIVNPYNVMSEVRYSNAKSDDNYSETSNEDDDEEDDTSDSDLDFDFEL